MSCVNLSVTLHRKIRRIVLPTLAGSMALVAAVAVILGWESLGAALGAERWGTQVAEYFWIVFWIAVAALLALGVGLSVVWLLSRSIARPIASLAHRADELTERGGTAQFPTDTRICEIDQLANSFNRLFALQEQQAIELRNLIQNVLHDIRAPINHISQQAERIYDKSCDPLQAAGLITECCDKVIRLFETHAEIARNNACAEPLLATRQNLSAIVSFIIELYAPVAEMKDVKLTGPSGGQGLFVMGHKSKLEQMIGNLVDNAIKFTPSGGSVTVTLCGGTDEVELCVSDTGVGIPPESLPHVFDRYFRSPTATEHSGSGLGLTLVQSIVNYYHGSITCKSALGRGSSFTVRLRRQA